MCYMCRLTKADYCKGKYFVYRINNIYWMHCREILFTHSCSPNFGDPLTFHLVPSSGQSLKLSNTLVFESRYNVYQVQQSKYYRDHS